MKSVLAGSALIALLAFAVPSRAAAQDMPADMHTYFEGEKTGALWFFGTGVVAIGAGAWLLDSGRTTFEVGLSYPVLTVGVVELLAGAILYLRTDGQVRRLDAQLASDPVGFRNAELRRMRRVDVQFTVLEIVEVGCIVVGGALAYAGYADDSQDGDALAGIGVGLMVQGAAMLALDGFAHRRGRRYERALEGFHVSMNGITYAGSF